mgnify:CR=1 FL=1
MTSAPMEAPQGWLNDFAADGKGENAKTGIVLVHGFTGSPAAMRPWAHFLNERVAFWVVGSQWVAQHLFKLHIDSAPKFPV